MSSSDIRKHGIRSPSKKQVERIKWVQDFIKKNERHPTLKEISKRFKISLTSSWETIQRFNKNTERCPYCLK